MKKQRRIKKPNHPSSGRQLEAPTAASKSQKSNNAAKKKSKQRSDNMGMDDDIVAQLQLQRQRQKQQSKERAVAADNSQNTEPSPTDPKATRPSDKHDAAKCEGNGDFQYDPILKRYFPKSTFQSHGNNDVCIQRIQKKIAPKEVDANSNKQRWLLMNEEPFHLTRGNVTDDDVRRVIFRGMRLPTNRCNNGDLSTLISHSGKKKKKQRNNADLPSQKIESPPPIPCTERTTFLLATSLEYCTITQRRNAIASMLGPMSVARRAKVVPTQSTLETIQNNTKKCMHSYIDREESAYEEPIRPYAGSIQRQKSWTGDSVQGSSLKMQRWFSMLHPLKAPRESPIRNQQPPWSPTVPYDCKCKSYLHPTAPTFDVLPGYSDRSSAAIMPYIATISNDAVYYRTPCSVRGYSAWELERLVSVPVNSCCFVTCILLRCIPPHFSISQRQFL
mmetsp:Transcript_9278/g.16176  ORF Transcript_9278/g.16176 Transcript_9278/m.16176 type:complete len:446 (+) Transcript_9278:115-1452(+)